jgi:hypothetical protein
LEDIGSEVEKRRLKQKWKEERLLLIARTVMTFEVEDEEIALDATYSQSFSLSTMK